MSGGRGRGRGRGNTLPAWMANNNQDGAEGSARSQQGLGYTTTNNGNHSRLHVDSWERDRGRGEMMNRPNNNFVREESSLAGMGRGRGRGRGRGINNRPAWMNNTDNNRPSSGPPTTDAKSSTGNKANNEGNDEEMELLLAQARQKRQQQQKQSSSQTHLSMSKEHDIKSSNTDTDAASKKLKSKEEKEQEELQKQRKLEEEAKEAARKMEEEAKRLEQLKEEEEQRQLRALVGDLSDNEEDRMMTDDNDKKRNHQDKDDDNDLFQFETEEEREERQARKRREERRRKLRKLEQTNKVKEEDVDMPRNVAGVIQSEQESENNNIVSIKMEVDANEDNHDKPQEQQEENSDDDSFDMFATTDNATPVPTQNSKNATNSKNDTKATAQECDDAEGYYKANIGEIITLPRETGAEDVVRFRVLGIIGKGVFASVIKCVEENGNGTQQDIASSRVVAMKVIRNNEVMARAAAKELSFQESSA